jgi:regulator of protease activity HflC (stomatin/prohibitin superfamily)
MISLKEFTVNPVTAFLALLCFLAGAAATLLWANPYLGALGAAIGVIVGLSLKVANVWQKFVILRLGKLQSVKGAGMFVIFPLVDRVIAVIDGRIQTTAFNAEQALTKDTVPVNVDAIIFWRVHDAESRIGNYQLPRGDRSRCADFSARDDRRINVGGPFV